MSKKIIIHENRRFDWTLNELAKIQFLWISGKKPSEIALEMKVGIEDIALVLMHLYFKGEISFDNKKGC